MINKTLHIKLRVRTFNLQGGLWFFVSFRKKISDNTRVNIYFFCRTKREIFFKNLTLGYMTKTLNQICFSLHQNQNILFINIGNPSQNFRNYDFNLNNKNPWFSSLLVNSNIKNIMIGNTSYRISDHLKYIYRY